MWGKLHSGGPEPAAYLGRGGMLELQVASPVLEIIWLPLQILLKLQICDGAAHFHRWLLSNGVTSGEIKTVDRPRLGDHPSCKKEDM